MLKCEQRARIPSRPSPNAIVAGGGTWGFVRFGEPLCLPSARRRLERQRAEGVCWPLNPLEAAWGFALAWLILWPLQHVPASIPSGEEEAWPWWGPGLCRDAAVPVSAWGSGWHGAWEGVSASPGSMTPSAAAMHERYCKYQRY